MHFEDHSYLDIKQFKPIQGSFVSSNQGKTATLSIVFWLEIFLFKIRNVETGCRI
jgi:hypothetical protein